jgi:hypothetical protein
MAAVARARSSASSATVSRPASRAVGFRLKFYIGGLSSRLGLCVRAVNDGPWSPGRLVHSEKWGKRYPAITELWENTWAGSPNVLPHRGPLRTGRASCPRIRLKQARWDRGLAVRCAVRPYGRTGCGPGVKRKVCAGVLVAGRR